jgi:uncharacterized protein
MKNGLRVHALGALLLTLLLTAASTDAPVADAAQRGDIETVRALVRQGSDVNAAQGDGMTALHWAARNGDAEMAALLLYAGANPEAHTRLGGYAPLHLAAKRGQAEVIAALVDGGADVHAVTSTGASALHYAAAAGRPDAVRALIDRGANLDAREAAAEQTPLIFATAEGRLEVMRVLIEAGADLSLQTTVVDYAARGKADGPARQRRQRLMAARKEADKEAREGTTGASETVADVAAAQLQSREAAEPKKEAKPALPTEAGGAARASEGNRRTNEPRPLSYSDLVGLEGGLTALHYAARDGRRAEARLLLDSGADVNEVTAGDHTSPLLIATINGNYDLAMDFLAAGADPNLESEDGAEPLFAALNNRWAPKAFYPQPTAFKQQETSYLELMRALLDAGAEVNHRTKRHIWYTSYNFDLLGVKFDGATAFWRAAYALDVPAMELLVAYGADPTIPTFKTPSRRFRRGPARAEGEPDPSGLPPVPMGGPAVWPIHAASGVGYGVSRAGNSHRHVPDGWVPAVRYLVEVLGVDVNQRDKDGYSAVHNAAARGDNELIKYLVSQGADVSYLSRRGQTTVDMANGPQQRVQPFPATIALLEGLGAVNNHNCQSC